MIRNVLPIRESLRPTAGLYRHFTARVENPGKEVLAERAITG